MTKPVQRFALASLFVVVAYASPARADTAEACAVAAEKGYELRQNGRFVEAIQKLTQCSRDECPRVLRNDCREGLVDIQSRAPRIVVRVRDRAGNDVLDARVSVDGALVSSLEQANGRVVDPGPHVVRAEGAARQLAEQTVLVTAAERVRMVDLKLETREEPAPAPAATPPQASVSPMPEQLGSRKPNRSGAYAAGAIGASFLATFAILGTWAFVEHRSLESSCGRQCFRPEAEAAHARAIVADAALGAAIVSFGVATVLWLTAPSPDQRKLSGSRP